MRPPTVRRSMFGLAWGKSLVEEATTISETNAKQPSLYILRLRSRRADLAASQVLHKFAYNASRGPRNHYESSQRIRQATGRGSGKTEVAAETQQTTNTTTSEKSPTQTARLLIERLERLRLAYEVVHLLRADSADAPTLAAEAWPATNRPKRQSQESAATAADSSEQAGGGSGGRKVSSERARAREMNCKSVRLSLRLFAPFRSLPRSKGCSGWRARELARAERLLQRMRLRRDADVEGRRQSKKLDRSCRRCCAGSDPLACLEQTISRRALPVREPEAATCLAYA